MSNAIFPTLPGIEWPAGKTPRFATRVQTSASLRELRLYEAAYPLWDIKLSFEFLRQDEFDLLCGFFLQRKGAFDSFLWTDQDDCQAHQQIIGIGDGARTQWQLVRSLGGFIEPVENVKQISEIRIGDAVLAPEAYTLTATGLLCLVAPLPAQQTLSWSGSYYYRCRFQDDSADFEKFMQGLWQLKTLRMTGATGNKV